MNEEHRSLIFKVFILAIVLDGRFANKEAVLLESMCEAMGFGHKETKRFAAEWCDDCATCFTGGEPIQLRDSGLTNMEGDQSKFVHISFEHHLRRIQTLAEKA